MAEADPWAGLIDPRAALARRRMAVGALAISSQPCADPGERENTDNATAYDSFSHSSHSSQGSCVLSPTGHNSPKDRNTICSSSLSDTYAPLAGLLDPDPGCVGDTPPAKVAKRLEYELTPSDISTIALAAAAKAFYATNTVPSPAAHLSGPAEWREGLSRLNRDTPPCPGFRTGEWGERHRVIAHFMEHCAAEAFARGWTALDLFGVHRAAGAAAVESCGALMLPLHASATSVSAEVIVFGRLVYRRRPLPQAVLAWDFAQARRAPQAPERPEDTGDRT